ncbi:MAG: hypothetical protein WA824_12720 [Candidatus Sulfotelmatobacter sp.]
MEFRIEWIVVSFCLLAASAFAQNPATSAPAISVPPVIQFSSIAADEAGTLLSGTVSITFSLYNSASGGRALWSETQNVRLGSGGQYSVYLGLTQTNGLPASLFASGQPSGWEPRSKASRSNPEYFSQACPTR